MTRRLWLRSHLQGRRFAIRVLVLAALTGLVSHTTAAGLEPAANVASACAREHARTGIALGHASGRTLPRGTTVCMDPAAAQGAGRKFVEVAVCFAAGLALGAALATGFGGIVGVSAAAAAALNACF